MKPFYLSLGFLLSALRVLAFTPTPFTEAVSFSYKLAPTGGTYAGGGSVTISAESSASSGGGVTGVESVVTVALLRPGKEYPLTISGSFIGTGTSGGNVTVGLNAPSGYAVYIDQRQQDVFTRNFSGFGNSSYNEPHIIELRPIANSAPAEAGSFSGIEIGKSVSWEVGLGRLRAGQSAGRIVFREVDLTTSPASRDRLYYANPDPSSTGPSARINVARDGLTLRQIKTPQVIADFIDVPGDGYTINFYAPTASALATWNGSLYVLSGETAWRTIRVQSPGANQLTITETEGSVERTSTLALTSGTVASGTFLWTLQEGDHLTTLRTTTHSSSVPTTNQRDDLVTVRYGGPSGTIVAQTKYHYALQPWNIEEITQVIVDPNGAALTTSYAYFTTSSAYGNYRKIQSVTGPTGNWTSYLYYDDWNRRGRLAVESHPYLDSPATVQAAAITVGNSISYDYVADYSGRYGNESNRQYKTTNIQTGQKLTTPTIGSSRNGVAYTTYVTNDYSASSSAQQTTTEITDPLVNSGDFGNRVCSVKRADQSQDSYAYYAGTYSGTTFTAGVSGTYFRTNVWHGSTNSGGADSFTAYGGAAVATIYLVANKSTMEVTIQDPAGLVLRKETHVYVGGGSFTLLASENCSYDLAGRFTGSVASNNATVENHYSGGRMDYTNDATGTRTNFTYDLLGRVASSAKQSVGTSGSYPAQATITTSNMYDAAGHLTQTQTAGGALTLTSTAQYDLAGRPTQQVQFSGSANSLTTSYGYSAGGRIVTATLPGGTATKTTETFLDGQLKQVTGSAVVAENYSYWIDGAGQSVRQATFGGNTAMWTKTYSDWLGRPTQEQKPGWNGTAVDKFWYYNSAGQIWKFTQPGLAATLYEYDSLGRQTAQGLDINGNGVLERTGNDRITQQATGIYTWDSGTSWWSLAQTFVYADPASSSATNIETTVSRLNLDSGNFAQSITYDVNWNPTTRVTSFDRNGKLVTTTTTAPDSTTSAQQKFYNGLLMESRDTAGVNKLYGYDVLGRQTQTRDLRHTGSTTTTFATGSNFVSWVTDPANVFQAIYQYDAAGRAIAIAAPNPNYGIGSDSRSALYTRYSYNDRNQQLQQWGDIVSPVESVYDSLGRQTELHTYRVGSGWSGSSWPTAATGTADVTAWAYHAATGLLASKTDASGHAVTFTYTQAGQLERRTLARGVWTNYAYSPTTAETTAVTYSDGTPALSYTYNRIGQVATVGDYAGTRTFTYNVGGALELQREDQPAFLTGRRLTYGYDSTAGAVGRLKTMSMGSAGAPTADQSVTYGYAADGRLNSINGGGQTFAYAYTGNSHLINTVSNTVANYVDTRLYDSTHDWTDSRVTTISGASKASFVYTQDTFGRVTQTTKTGELYNRYGIANEGLNTNYGYDDRSEIITDQTKVGSTSVVLTGRNDSHVYDSIGNRSTVTHNGNPAGYTVNNLNQYVSRGVPGFFDVAGAAQNGATVTVDGSSSGVSRSGDYYFKGQSLTNTGAAVSATIPITDGSAVGSLTAFLAGTPETMTYDLDGNLTSDGRWDYSYDAENRLNWMSTRDAAVSTLVPKVAMQILYDYLGRRIWKISYTWNKDSLWWNVAHHEMFIYNGWNLIAEINGGTGAITKKFLWGLDLSGTGQGAGGVGGLLMTQDGGQSYLPIYDANGNVHGMIKASDGTIAAAYEYDAFGNTLRESGTYAASNSFRYSTKYTDIESGLIYYGQRYYSPSLGRFINKDPIEEKGGINLYGFCGNNGVNRFDYLGNFVWTTQNSPNMTKEQLDQNNALQNIYANSHDYGTFDYGLANSASFMFGGSSYGWNASMGDPNIMGGTDDPPPPPPPDPNAPANSASITPQSKTYTGTDGRTYTVTNDSSLLPSDANIVAWGGKYGLDATAQLIRGGTNAGLLTTSGTRWAGVSVVTYARLAQGIYDKSFTGVDGLSIVPSSIIDSKATGQRSAVFSNGTDNVMAFAGTDPSSFANWRANFAQGFGISSAQYEQGIQSAKDNAKIFGGLSFTGHSLGGGIASASAIELRARAVTFNAAAVHDNTIAGFSRSNGNITSYYSSFDVLHFVNAITPSSASVPGQRISLGAAGFHGMNSMLNAFGGR